MEFKPQMEIPASFKEHQKKTYEKYGFDIIITPEELEDECNGNSLCERALTDMLQYAIRYALDVWKMKELLSRQNEFEAEEWRVIHEKVDRERSQLHNTYIDSINILSRQLVKNDKNIDWVKKLYSGTEVNRAACGKFAIMITYWLSVNRSS
jgi:hypothetical protein